MKNLMKYEFRKTWTTKLLILGITAVLEVLFLITLFFELENMLAVSIFLLSLVAMGGTMLIGIQSVVTLHRDMNTKQSYMLFMTPNSNYKILGSKLLENGLSLILADLFFYALGFLDVTLLFAKHGELDQLWDMFSQFLHAFNANIPLDAWGIAVVLIMLLCNWIRIISTAFFADILSTALLSGKKMNGFVSFVIFILLTILMTYIGSLVPNSWQVTTRLLAQSGIALILSFLMYLVSARLMDKSLSV